MLRGIIRKFNNSQIYRFATLQKFDPAKDYYLELQVEKSATIADIKKKYYDLAKIYHPDVNNKMDDKFKLINEAYQVLGDEEIKREYDQVREGGGQARTQFYQQNTQQARPSDYYHYGYGRSGQNRQQSYEAYRAQQKAYYYQYEKNNRKNDYQGYSSNFYQNDMGFNEYYQRRVEQKFGMYMIAFGALGILFFFDYFFRNMLQSRQVLVVDEQTGQVFVTTKEKLQEVERRNYQSYQQQQFYERQEQRKMERERQQEYQKKLRQEARERPIINPIEIKE